MDFNEVKDFIIPVSTGIFAWFSKDRILNVLNIKQKKSEVENDQIKVVQANLDLYQEMLTDMDKRYKQRLEEMEADLLKLKELNKELTDIIEKQKDFISRQASSLRRYVKKFGELTNKD